MNTKWTAADQRALDELTKRKADFETTAGVPVNNIAKVLAAELESFGYATSDDKTVSALARALRNNAEAVRDVLEPFDSGVRCSAPGTLPSMPPIPVPELKPRRVVLGDDPLID